MMFGKNIYNFDSYNVLLAIATNKPVLLKTGFVVYRFTNRYKYSDIYRSVNHKDEMICGLIV